MIEDTGTNRRILSPVSDEFSFFLSLQFRFQRTDKYDIYYPLVLGQETF